MIITLAAVLLVSAILLVFFDESTLNRQISFSSAGQYRADTMAHTALDTIVGDLRNEIVSSSTVTTVGTNSIYVPVINQTVEPYQEDLQGYINLVAQSTAGTNLWLTGANYTTQAPDRSAPGNSTLTPSFNQHYINVARWNKPGLLSDPGSGTTPDLPIAPPAGGNTYVPPDWVMVTRSGPLDNAATVKNTSTPLDLVDKTIGTVDNTNFVVGRYAYTIYNEGGLLDANVAGCPQKTTDGTTIIGADPNTKRGLLAQINLADLLSNQAIGESPSQATTDADALVKWRNQASAASLTAFTNYVYNATNGFTTVAPGDQAFLSRQDLINYVTKNSSIPTKALPFLSTFTRELNAPSYTPPPLTSYGTAPSPTSKPMVNNGEGYHYSPPPIPLPKTATDDVFNPSLINVRVTTSFQRYSDGTWAQPGEPLIKYRFPLCRLAWIGYNGPGQKTANVPGAASATDILNAFGLTQSTGPEGGVNWTYNHGSTNRILTLSEVANAGREPDFFELLQAGMFIGSLGKQAGNTCFLAGDLDSNPYYQVIQIGANLIDQADSDSYPTRIVFDSTNPKAYEFDGVENLPSISRIWVGEYLHRTTPTPSIGEWYVPEIWNPNISTVGINATHPGPTSFRFTVNSSLSTQQGLAAAFLPGVSSSGGGYSPQMKFPRPSDSGGGINGGISFSANPNLVSGSGSFTFATPTLLTPPNAQATVLSGNDNIHDGSGAPNTPGSTFVGISLGEIPVDPSWLPIPFSGDHVLYHSVYVSLPLTFQLWYQNTATGQWVAYNRHRFHQDNKHLQWQAHTLDGVANPPNSDTIVGLALNAYWFCSDPRTDRFGMFGTSLVSYNGFQPVNNPPSPTTISEAPMRTSATGNGQGQNGRTGWPGNSAPSGTTPPGWGTPTSCYPYMWSNNTSIALDGYQDPDGVQRPADGAYGNGLVGAAGYPLAINGLANNTVTPVILNRPFRSVADMGYAFRDEPWKHIDFFTAQSGDAALLDLFCIDEPPRPPTPAVATDPVPAIAEAGRIDLNTRQVPVLQAVLAGAIQWDDGNTTLTAGDAGTLASNLVTLTSASPLLNRSELVTRWISSIPALSTSPQGTLVKRQREAAVRALSDVGNTRTWNLLIDVIAQSGRYIAGGKADLNTQFMVEGERRYWLHVAIDRYTGKVVAQSLEPVYE